MTDARGLSSRRQRTRQAVLSVIRERGAVTRGELSDLTGLSRSAVAAGVVDLLTDGLVVEQRTPKPVAARGRPRNLLHPAGRHGLVAGIDFGHAHVSAALADSTGQVMAEQRVAVDVDGQAAAAMDTATELLHTLLTEAHTSISDVTAVAAGVPGPIDLRTHRVSSPHILSSWVGLPIEDELVRRLDRPVQVRNDADMGAHGEHRFGAARGCRDFIYVKASHGIGAGLMLNGKTYRGTAGIAGEIGHTQLPEAGSWCRCGNRGCLETVVSITEIRRQLALTTRSEPADTLEVSLTDLGRDPVASHVLTEAGRTIGRVLADLCNCLNPAAIIVGGELGTAGEPVVAGIRESISRRAQPATAATVEVRAAQLGLRSELLGAVATALDMTHSQNFA